MTRALAKRFPKLQNIPITAPVGEVTTADGLWENRKRLFSVGSEIPLISKLLLELLKAEHASVPSGQLSSA
jgi:hypothetical protein